MPKISGKQGIMTGTPHTELCVKGILNVRACRDSAWFIGITSRSRNTLVVPNTKRNDISMSEQALM